MPQLNHQTIKLGKGKHTAPQFGACVMELASMLAGEPFSDRPRSVSRPIAAFLRCYNDKLDDTRRQDLYAYAAKVVGSVSTPEVERARAARLVEWADERRSRQSRWSRLVGVRSRPDPARDIDPESAGCDAVRAIRRVCDETHTKALELIDELVECATARPGNAAASSPPIALDPPTTLAIYLRAAG